MSLIKQIAANCGVQEHIVMAKLSQTIGMNLTGVTVNKNLIGGPIAVNKQHRCFHVQIKNQLDTAAGFVPLGIAVSPFGRDEQKLQQKKCGQNDARGHANERYEIACVGCTRT